MVMCIEYSREQRASKKERIKKLSRAEMRIRLRLEPFNLTKKETEIVILLLEGLDRDDILCRCKITNNTFKTHIRKILRKLNVGKRSQIASKLDFT